jgi:hypothetical protein
LGQSSLRSQIIVKTVLQHPCQNYLIILKSIPARRPLKVWGLRPHCPEEAEGNRLGSLQIKTKAYLRQPGLSQGCRHTARTISLISMIYQMGFCKPILIAANFRYYDFNDMVSNKESSSRTPAAVADPYPSKLQLP